MRFFFLLIFILVPILEIWLFIQVDSLIGLWPTLASVVLTAVIGTWLMRQQGFAVLIKGHAMRCGWNAAEEFAGFVCFAATNFIKRSLHIDDSLDVFPVHGVGGILGTVLTGVFASNALGIFSGHHDINIAKQVGVQVVGVGATLIYTAVATAIILFITDKLFVNRMSDDDQREGLDLVDHNERGYDL